MNSYGCSVISNTSYLNGVAYAPRGPLWTGATPASARITCTGTAAGAGSLTSPSQRPVPSGSIAYSAGSTTVIASAPATSRATPMVVANVDNDGDARVGNAGGAGGCIRTYYAGRNENQARQSKMHTGPLAQW